MVREVANLGPGCQSVGVVAAPKYLVAASDIERKREFLIAAVAERTLREICAYPFQLVLKLSDPWCLMTR